jgi:hypothetical protein
MSNVAPTPPSAFDWNSLQRHVESLDAAAESLRQQPEMRSSQLMIAMNVSGMAWVQMAYCAVIMMVTHYLPQPQAMYHMLGWMIAVPAYVWSPPVFLAIALFTAESSLSDRAWAILAYCFSGLVAYFFLPSAGPLSFVQHACTPLLLLGTHVQVARLSKRYHCLPPQGATVWERLDASGAWGGGLLTILLAMWLAWV